MVARNKTGGRPPNNHAFMKYCSISKGMDCLIANYKRQDFCRHSHREYVVGLIESGRHDVWCRGSWWRAGSNSIATLAPDEPHFGGAGSELGWSQTMFYIPEASVRDIFDDDDRIVRNGIGFNSPFSKDERISAKLRSLRDSLSFEEDALHAEELLQETLRAVFSICGSVSLRNDCFGLRASSHLSRSRVSARQLLAAHIT